MRMREKQIKELRLAKDTAGFPYTQPLPSPPTSRVVGPDRLAAFERRCDVRLDLSCDTEVCEKLLPSYCTLQLTKPPSQPHQVQLPTPPVQRSRSASLNRHELCVSRWLHVTGAGSN